jgi:hypothetical protein
MRSAPGKIDCGLATIGTGLSAGLIASIIARRSAFIRSKVLPLPAAAGVNAATPLSRPAGRIDVAAAASSRVPSTINTKSSLKIVCRSASTLPSP